MRVAIACALAVILGMYPFVPLPVRAAPTELFFSEYVEGSSNNKALEIFNGTGAPVNLGTAGYNVQMFFNGSATAGLTINLVGTVAPGDVFVLAHSSATAVILAQADQTNGAGWFNGNDAVVLRKGTAVIDTIGQVGMNPGFQWGTGETSTEDNTLRRRPSIQGGDSSPLDPFDPAVEWDGLCRNAFDGLGAHPATAQLAPVIPIGAVQGSIGDGANGRTFASPFAGQIVAVRGVIYEKTLARTSQGISQFGVFIQNTGSAADADSNTSDGAFGFSFESSSIPIEASPLRYVPQVGDEVVVSACVTEFFNLTELTSLRLLNVVRTGVNVDAEVSAFEVNPPSDFAEAGRYWERREGMRARIPAGSLVVGPRVVFSSTMDGEAWVIRPDHPLAGGRPAYERRVFRDPHPLDDMPSSLFDNGNGFRIVLGSLGIKSRAGDNRALIAPARIFDRLADPAIGGVYFSFSKYQIMVDRQLRLHPGTNPAGNGHVSAYERDEEVRIATFNVENLYDFRDDPTDGCDFAGNSGCPGVNPPFDYVPESQAAYQQKVHELARQIRTDLHAPDIVMVQEVEDQDICNLQGTDLACGGTTMADGQPDPLQDVALEIARLGGPAYAATTDRDGADDRGIINAYLFRTDRVELVSAAAGHPVLGSLPQVDYRGTALGYNADVENPKALNAVLPADVDRSTGTDGSNVFTRPVQVGLFRIRRDAGSTPSVDLYILNNHFSSTPNARVGQRKEQAAYNAAIVATLHQDNPQVRIIVGGDLNVFPRPDDPFAPGDALFPSDQLGALYGVGLTNLWETLVVEDPAAAYSYVFEGQAQTLDQLFVTPSLAAVLARVRAAHVNSDWPADHPDDGARGASDHDPQVADFRLFLSGP